MHDQESLGRDRMVIKHWQREDRHRSATRGGARRGEAKKRNKWIWEKWLYLFLCEKEEEIDRSLLWAHDRNLIFSLTISLERQSSMGLTRVLNFGVVVFFFFFSDVDSFDPQTKALSLKQHWSRKKLIAPIVAALRMQSKRINRKENGACQMVRSSVSVVVVVSVCVCVLPKHIDDDYMHRDRRRRRRRKEKRQQLPYFFLSDQRPTGDREREKRKGRESEANEGRQAKNDFLCRSREKIFVCILILSDLVSLSRLSSLVSHLWSMLNEERTTMLIDTSCLLLVLLSSPREELLEDGREQMTHTVCCLIHLTWLHLPMLPLTITSLQIPNREDEPMRAWPWSIISCVVYTLGQDLCW